VRARVAVSCRTIVSWRMAAENRRTVLIGTGAGDEPRLIPTLLLALCALGTLLTASPAWSQLIPGSMDVHWNEGSPDCAKNPQPPLQVHRYNAQTFVLRENLCSTFEAPFMYLLIGATKALLIDTGDVAGSNQMPLAKTVMNLLPGDGSMKLPLLVVHTHRHLDHRAGDVQFTHLANVQVVGFDIESVRRYYNFTDWPNGLAEINLGDRTVDVIPTPGHNETEVSFYDRNTGLFFSGDFLMPGRLLIDDTKADLASAVRAATFVKDRPVSFVLGGHIEKDARGNLFPWESQYHPHEHVLQLTKEDLLALPAAIGSFNGFYTTSGHFVMSNAIHTVIALAILAALVLVALGLIPAHYIRRRRRTPKQQKSFGE
jgi:hydroxyacylglutathione hydrolase